MRSYDEYKQILELWELGINKKAIARYTGIPRGTVCDCINRYGTVEKLNQHSEETLYPILFKILTGELEGDHQAILKAYAYLLGLYLGDGNIVHMRRIYRLRVTLDARYPNIINSCVQAGKTLLPDNRVGLAETYYQGHLSYVDVSLYHKELPLFFPQHGAGAKHLRKIALESWQQQIVETHPLEFFRGLYHSDGSRYSNIVNGKDYPRYQFTNYSDDIRKLFCDTCDHLNINWTVKHFHKERETDIYISKRKDVEYLDRMIGPKS